ncbi:peptidoglycan DD-metalloendopeptidase family protein [candidate division CSSED10-310 bacterium]|uniref:Peptidoglycan DD-metalloendopeptidase family protein n=1 Tax=candidate division CSSED10-310 bacterium TaxID=2855610 RepID=A0ABV6YY47_UNCC1
MKNCLGWCFVIVALLSQMIFQSCSCLSQDPDPESIRPTPTVTPVPTATPTPFSSYTLRNGDSLYSVLISHDLDPNSIQQLIDDCRSVYNLAQVSAGKTFQYRQVASEISDFRYPVDEEHILIATRSDQGFQCSLHAIPFQVKTNVYGGIINTCLWEAAIEAGIDPQTLMALSSIYDWDIDFNTEFQPQDQFNVLVEEKHLDGHFHHFGRILASNIILSGQEHPAVYFEAPDGHTDYYDKQGNCLRKNFLKAPLHYSRISSGYTSRRRHPILKIVRPHWGIDYAAPSGTHVRAIADGVISYAGTKSGYGRYIRIKHGSTPYETGYGHLKGFARGIKRNARVKQGQVIGYVGTTGLSTGPHLDYRVYYHGKPINPLRVKTTPARKLNSDEMLLFNNVVQQRMALFQGRINTPSESLAQVQDK